MARQGGELGPASALTQTWDVTRDMKVSSGISPHKFADMHGNEIRDSFPGSLSEAISIGAIPVLICALNEMAAIGPTLRGLSKQTRQVQPVVVDNGSTDDTGAIAKDLGAEVVREDEPGLIHALRTGFSHLRSYGGPILHIDADTVPVPTWAETLTDYDSRLPQGGEVFGPSVFYEFYPHRSRGRRSPVIKNAAFSLAAYGLDLRDTPGKRRARGCNGVILPDSDGRILDRLSRLTLNDESYLTDVAVRETVEAAGGEVRFSHSPRAIAVTSGDRYPTIRALVRRAVAPEATKQKLYKGF